MHYFVNLIVIGGVVGSVCNAVSIPISTNGGNRVHSVFATQLNGQSPEFRLLPSDENTVAVNESTNETASILSHLFQNNLSTADLAHVRNPRVVAKGLESAAKYLLNQGDHHVDRNRTEDYDKSADLTRVLDGFVFLNNLYDALVRPGQFDAKGPVKVSVKVYLHDWFEVNEQRNELTVTLTLVQNWTDPRLAYESRLSEPGKVSFVTLTSQMHLVEIWLPDTVILNEKRSYKHDVTVSNELVRISPKGRLSREQRMTVTVSCPFHLSENFPFDSPRCFFFFTSFSWNASQVVYENPAWELFNGAPERVGSGGGYRILGYHISARTFDRSDQNLGVSSGVEMVVTVRRNQGSYVSTVFVPLASFTLIAIAGLLASIGPQAGSVISYFMFGLMSIFMAISFNGPHFILGHGPTSLDSYYSFCVFTVLITGIVNILKLSGSGGGKRGVEESYEMRHNNGAHRSNSRTRRERSDIAADRLWSSENADMTEEDDNGGGGGERGAAYSFIASVKLGIGRCRRKCGSLCGRMSNMAIWITLAYFIIWNVYFWTKNLTSIVDENYRGGQWQGQIPWNNATS